MWKSIKLQYAKCLELQLSSILYTDYEPCGFSTFSSNSFCIVILLLSNAFV
jgi:hypothetical protein